MRADAKEVRSVACACACRDRECLVGHVTQILHHANQVRSLSEHSAIAMEQLITKLLELRIRQHLRKDVCNVLVAWRESQANRTILDQFTKPAYTLLYVIGGNCPLPDQDRIRPLRTIPRPLQGDHSNGTIRHQVGDITTTTRFLSTRSTRSYS